jgi:hypothetical protein
MQPDRLASALESRVGAILAKELVSDFLKIREDLATNALERASPGKFVETEVQCLQQIAYGRFDEKPDVDVFLARKAENEMALPEHIRICVPRIARVIYTLRSKRNIAHKSSVDPNTIDLATAHQNAVWIMAELVRDAQGISMQEAGNLIKLLEVPVNLLVEEIGDVRLVHADVSIRTELLILLHSYYPEAVPLKRIFESTEHRSTKSVRNQLNALKSEKLVFGDTTTGYRLTRSGYAAAADQIRRLLH